MYSICSGKHFSRRCPKVKTAPVTDLATFKNVTPLDNITRAAFSSVKGGRLLESVKKLKESRREKRETTNINALAAHIKQVREQYRKYIDEKRQSLTPDDSIVGTWKAEVAALLNAIARIPEVIELSDDANPTECTIVHLMNTLC